MDWEFRVFLGACECSMSKLQISNLRLKIGQRITRDIIDVANSFINFS